MRASLLLAAVGVVCVPMLSADPAQAQATRTWVSGVGDDVNPCSRTAPCKTFAGAISKTAAGGEINCMDPGGFGSVTITKSMTIDCAGTIGSILASGTNGVVVNDSLTATPNTIRVTLRNLSINGAGTTAGTVGVNYVSGKTVIIENVRIFGFKSGNATGIRMTSSGTGGNALYVSNTRLEDNGTGIFVDPTGGSAQVGLTRVELYKNTGDGFRASGAPGGTIFAGVFDSVSSLNGGHGFKAEVPAGGAAVTLSVQRSAANNNGAGGFTADGSGATVFIDQSMAAANGTGFLQANAGQIRSYGNNAVDTSNGVQGGTSGGVVPPL